MVINYALKIYFMKLSVLREEETSGDILTFKKKLEALKGTELDKDCHEFNVINIKHFFNESNTK